MAKITLYVPDGLRRRIDSPEADEINWSRVFRRAAIEELSKAGGQSRARR